MTHTLPIIAVVLCGGKSTRMGTDKGLLPIQSHATWAQFVGEKAALANVEVVYSISQSQISTYSKHIAQQMLITDDDNLLVKGPLKGLLSVHQAYPAHHLLLLSCDMLHIDVAVLQQLVQHCVENPTAHFWAFTTGSFAQPFCAIYSAFGLQQQLQQQSSITNFSLQSLLKQGTTAFIATTNEQVFFSYNTLDSNTLLQTQPTTR